MPGAPAELPFSTEPDSNAIRPSYIPSTTTFYAATFVTPDSPAVVEAGGLSSDDLLDLWKSVTDPSYHLPILEKPNGGGDEVKAALAIHRSVAQKIDASTQSLFIMPWSGQTSDPAHLQAYATGFLQVERLPTELFPAWIPVIFQPDQFIADHVGIDWSDEGPVEVLTGRRYFFTSLTSLGPGQLGPLIYPARAEKPGASYNIPGPNTIVRVGQAGAGLNNVALSTSAPSAGVNLLTLAPAPDLLSAAQIGQYVRLSAPPAVAGQVRRVVAYQPPLDSLTGGSAVLDTLGVFAVGSVVGTFRLGEEVSQASSGAHGYLVSLANGHFAIETFVGTFTAAAILGTAGGATASITSVVRASALPAATSVSWVVLDWELDVGVSVTNPESFTGGRLPVLEELGGERAIYQASGEPEETYRKRVHNAADVVSPNALLRSANRILADYGGQGCLREAGAPKLRGLFFDVDPDGNPDHAFALDMDPAVRIGDRWKVLLDFTEMRAFFLMGIPAFGLGDFSLYADTDPGVDGDAYLDGYAITDAALSSAVYSSLVRAKAGGVGFDLYVESDGCV